MIELKRDHLIFRFPEVHKDAECRISFQRTLRIPDDNRDYSLPPGLGEFPLNLVDDYGEQCTGLPGTRTEAFSCRCTRPKRCGSILTVRIRWR